MVMVFVWFKTIVLFMPEKWRDRFSELQFGRWAAKRKER